MISKICLFFGALFYLNFAVAYDQQYATSHCAKMGGVDITKSTIMHSENLNDIVFCEIEDEHKFQQYFKAEHPYQEINPPLVKHNNLSGASGSVGSVPNSFYDDAKRVPYEFVYYVNNDESVGHTLYGHVRIESEFSCGWSSCSPYDTDTKFFVDPKTMSKKIVSSISWWGDSWAWNCSTTTHDNICAHSAYAMLDGSSGGGVITRYIKNTTKSINPNLGIPEQTYACNMPSSFVDSPINIATGNKFEKDIDVDGSLPFIRYYNSLNDDASKRGQWTNNYSAYIDGQKYNPDTIQKTIHKVDGRIIPFYTINGAPRVVATELGTIKNIGSGGYEYRSPFNEVSDFDSKGRLTRTIDSGGIEHNLSYPKDNVIVVSDNFKNTLTITENSNHQPVEIKSSKGKIVTYQYDNEQRLIKVTKNQKSRIYHYEDSKFPRALTGITNENGNRYITLEYDDLGRAISSSHDGKDVVNIKYVSDSQSTVTGPLVKTSTYNFTNIDGVKRITSINGAQSSQCPFVNSSYQYNSRGLVTLMTDGRGTQTKYEYNDAGQEISRTLANGKATAITIKTTWDENVHLPKTETYPDKVITYSYDAYGNVVSQTTKSIN